MTPIEYHYALKDNGMLATQQMELDVHTTFEAMRLQTVFHNNMNPYIKKKIKKPEDLISFAWDKDKRVKTQTAEEMKAVMLSIASAFSVKKDKK